MHGLPPYVRDTIAKLIRESPSQCVSLHKLAGDMQTRFPHLPFPEREIFETINAEAAKAGRGIELNREEKP